MSDAHRARILVVDDDERVRAFLKDLLEQNGYQVEMVADGIQALSHVERQRPDLILLDVMMPGMSGIEVLKALKAPTDNRFLPIILLTGDTELDTRLQGLKLGADDYLIKPANSREVLARIEALLRIKRLQDQISSSRRELEDASLLDPATGLHGARYIEIRLSDEFKRAERYNEPLSCILMQVENFASLKSNQGDAFDTWLKNLANVIRASVREFDLVIREREERFLVLLPRTHFAGSMAVASRLWSSVRAFHIGQAGSSQQLEATIGVAFYPDRDISSKQQLLDKVERALDKARAEGIGQICLYQQTAYFFRPDRA